MWNKSWNFLHGTKIQSFRKKITIILNLARKFQHILCENERYVCKTQTKKSRQIEGMNTHDYLKSKQV